MKLRASTKIALGFIVLVAVAYGGSVGYTKWRLTSVNLDPIPTSDICLLAISPKAGVKILVANRMVQIVEASSAFGAVEESGKGAESGSVKKRIPIKELIGILGGDQDSVQGFIQKMKEINEDAEPVEDAPLWTSDALEKAMEGDAAMKKKLEMDLNCTLDGKPLPQLNRLAFFDGIRIQVPVTLNIPNAKGKTISGFDVVSFRPRFLTRFYKQMRERFYDKAQLQTYYTAFLRDDNGPGEVLTETLKNVIAAASDSAEMQKVTKIVGNSIILVNQSMIQGVEMKEQPVGKDVTYDLKLKLTDEGKNRLWKFSAEGGTRIMVVSKGVAIAAATIGTQLNSQELAITQITDKVLVEDAVKLIQQKN